MDDQLLQNIKWETTQLNYQLGDLELDAEKLEALDPLQAVPHYRKNGAGEARYLYLIHPQRDGERQRDYIGSDPDKQTAALARCQAWIDLQSVLARHTKIANRLALVTGLLQRALRTAKGIA